MALPRLQTQRDFERMEEAAAVKAALSFNQPVADEPLPDDDEAHDFGGTVVKVPSRVLPLSLCTPACRLPRRLTESTRFAARASAGGDRRGAPRDSATTGGGSRRGGDGAFPPQLLPPLATSGGRRLLLGTDCAPP